MAKIWNNNIKLYWNRFGKIYSVSEIKHLEISTILTAIVKIRLLIYVLNVILISFFFNMLD